MLLINHVLGLSLLDDPGLLVVIAVLDLLLDGGLGPLNEATVLEHCGTVGLASASAAGDRGGDLQNANSSRVRPLVSG